eukprot:1039203-Pleurochrysis_carterae.AAC.4
MNQYNSLIETSTEDLCSHKGIRYAKCTSKAYVLHRSELPKSQKMQLAALQYCKPKPYRNPEGSVP